MVKLCSPRWLEAAIGRQLPVAKDHYRPLSQSSISTESMVSSCSSLSTKATPGFSSVQKVSSSCCYITMGIGQIA